MDSFNKLQEWYATHCDEDWEHSFGIKIDTLDNPGWSLVVELNETELESKAFLPIKLNFESDTDWLICEVKNKNLLVLVALYF